MGYFPHNRINQGKNVVGGKSATRVSGQFSFSSTTFTDTENETNCSETINYYFPAATGFGLRSTTTFQFGKKNEKPFFYINCRNLTKIGFCENVKMPRNSLESVVFGQLFIMTREKKTVMTENILVTNGVIV